MTERFAQLAELKEFWFKTHSNFGGVKPSNIPTIKVGPVASGSAVLSDADFVERIKKQHRQLLGLEMELYGVYTAARDAPYPQPIAIGIKGVSDFADNKKSDQYKAYAAYVSVQALSKFASMYVGSNP